jgi:hypothetical protein
MLGFLAAIVNQVRLGGVNGPGTIAQVGIDPCGVVMVIAISQGYSPGDL